MKKKYFWDYLLFGIVYFVQGALALTAVAMPIFLRDSLGLSISEIATLTAIATIPWTIKPLYGFITDYYPIRSLRRKPYLLIASLLASFGWFLTALNGTYYAILFAQLCAALGIAATDVCVDGLAVEKSTPERKGKIQTICWGGRSLGAVIAGVSGGYLLNFFPTQSIFVFTGVLPLLTFGTVLFVKEKPYPPIKKRVGDFLKNMVVTFYHTKMLWWVSAFLFLWFIAPSFGTPLFFYLKDTLGLSKTMLGVLQSTSSLGGVIGAVLFWKWFDKVDQKKLFIWLIVLNSAVAMLFYLVFGATSAFIVYFISGALSITAVIAAMRLIVEICPKGIEATTFALVTGITNLASGVLARYVGGQLYAVIGYKPLILVNAIIGLLPLLLIKPMFKELSSKRIR